MACQTQSESGSAGWNSPRASGLTHEPAPSFIPTSGASTLGQYRSPTLSVRTAYHRFTRSQTRSQLSGPAFRLHEQECLIVDRCDQVPSVGKSRIPSLRGDKYSHKCIPSLRGDKRASHGSTLSCTGGTEHIVQPGLEICVCVFRKVYIATCS